MPACRPIRVQREVERLLAESGRTDAEVIIGFTMRALAAEIYGVADTEEPTDAQLVAIRRAVGVLVRKGKAERGETMPPGGSSPWRRDHPNYPWPGNRRPPWGVVIFRVPTAEDEEAREAWWAANSAEFLAKFGKGAAA